MALYEQDPAGGAESVCSTETDVALGIVDCVPVECSWALTAGFTGEVWGVVDGAVEGTGEYLECLETNNLAAAVGICQ